MAPFGLKFLSNSDSVMGALAFACISPVVSMKKNLWRQNYSQQQARQMMLRKAKYDFSQVGLQIKSRQLKLPATKMIFDRIN